MSIFIVFVVVLTIGLFIYQLKSKSVVPREEILQLIVIIAGIAGLITFAIQELLAR